MTYFFLNILIGFIVDNMAQSVKKIKFLLKFNKFNKFALFEEEVKDEMKLTHSHGNHHEDQNQNFFSQLIIGKYYDIIVFSCFLVSLVEVYTLVNSSSLEGKTKYLTRLLTIGMEFLEGILYTVHFFAIVSFLYVLF